MFCDSVKLSETVVRNPHNWEEGARNLIGAAVTAGSRRFIATRGSSGSIWTFIFESIPSK